MALRNAKSSLIGELGELTEQVLLWERKIVLEKETQKAIDPESGQVEVIPIWIWTLVCLGTYQSGLF